MSKVTGDADSSETDHFVSPNDRTMLEGAGYEDASAEEEQQERGPGAVQKTTKSRRREPDASQRMTRSRGAALATSGEESGWIPTDEELERKVRRTAARAAQKAQMAKEKPQDDMAEIEAGLGAMALPPSGRPRISRSDRESVRESVRRYDARLPPTRSIAHKAQQVAPGPHSARQMTEYDLNPPRMTPTMERTQSHATSLNKTPMVATPGSTQPFDMSQYTDGEVRHTIRTITQFNEERDRDIKPFKGGPGKSESNRQKPPPGAVGGYTSVGTATDTGTDTGRRDRLSNSLIQAVSAYLVPRLTAGQRRREEDYRRGLEALAEQVNRLERRVPADSHALTSVAAQPTGYAPSPTAAPGPSPVGAPRGNQPPTVPPLALGNANRALATLSASRSRSSRPPRRSSSSPESPLASRRRRRSRSPQLRIPFKIAEFTAKAPANKPMEKTMEVTRWVQQIEALVQPKTDACRIQAAQMTCAGEAFGLVNSQSFQYITNWAEFRTRLYQEFGGTFDANHATAQLWGMRLKGPEGPADLCKRIRLFAYYIKHVYPDALGEVENTIKQVLYQALPQWLADMVRYQQAINTWQEASALAQAIWQNELNRPQHTRRVMSNTDDKEDRRGHSNSFNKKHDSRQSAEIAHVRVVSAHVAAFATPTGQYLAPLQRGTRYGHKVHTGLYCPVHDNPFHDAQGCESPNPTCHACGHNGHVWGSCPLFPPGDGDHGTSPVPHAANRGRGQTRGNHRGGQGRGRGAGQGRGGSRGGGNSGFSPNPTVAHAAEQGPSGPTTTPPPAAGPQPNIPNQGAP